MLFGGVFHQAVAGLDTDAARLLSRATSAPTSGRGSLSTPRNEPPSTAPCSSGASQRVERLASLGVAGRRDGRRRRRRQRRRCSPSCCAPSLACAASSSISRRRCATRRRSASDITFVEGSFFERGARRRRLHRLEDPPRLGRRAGDCDPADDSSRRAGGRPPRSSLETVLTEGNEPDGAKWLDLLMLTLVGGRERNEAEWRALLAEGGFEPVSMEDGLIEARCR